ncbi:PrgI family protein [Nocardioidaceae bacterium]|nr:PrgI family protein [Nocardioidaceae bacterium]
MSTTTEAAAANEPTYIFGPRDRRALLLGMRLPQLLLVALGGGVLLLGLLGTLVPFPLAAAIALLTLAVAFLPVQSRPMVDWVRPIGNYLFGRFTGEASYLGGPWALHSPDGGKRLALPGAAGPMQVRAFTIQHREIAVIRQGNRWVGVVQVAAPAYPLADRATQHERVSAWGSLLAQLGQEGSRIASVQWLTRTIPDSGRGLEDWWQRHGQTGSPAAESYRLLIDGAGPAATRHETFVAVAVDERRCRRALRAAGGGPEGMASVLATELSWLEAGLRRSDVEVLGWLNSEDLARLVRTQYDPMALTAIDKRRGAGVDLAAAGPMAAHAAFTHYRTDSGFHATYWVASWPRMQVEAAWLYPLLVLGGVRRTVSLTAEPVPPSQSFREVRNAKVQKLTEDAQRERLGQVDSALDDEAHAALLRRERELVAGHIEYRFTGYVTVSATTENELEDACAQVEQAAVRSVLEVRRVYGEQDQAFAAAALPLTRGVR